MGIYGPSFLSFSKIKHPNVTLLMAVCLDMNNKILSLVLEPFTTNINSMIYDSVSHVQRNS